VIDVGLLTLVVLAGAVVLDTIAGPTVRFRSDFATSTDLAIVSRRMVIVSALVGTTMSAAYATVSWLRWGATPGQLALRLRVTSEDGGRLTVGQAVSRWLLLFPPLGSVAALADVPNLAALLWGAAPVWSLVLLLSTVRDPQKRGVHDRIAGTVVCPAGGGG
jgi:uncharacterized RDD family membrane protein YckC